MKVLEELYAVALERKKDPVEGSYTCYLFEQGLDKILKKVGEECAETIIAAKNAGEAGQGELTQELCDLLYHLLVLMAQQGLPLADVERELERRRAKIGNLKKKHPSDHNS